MDQSSPSNCFWCSTGGPNVSYGVIRDRPRQASRLTPNADMPCSRRQVSPTPCRRFASCLVAVRRRAVLVLAKGERPKPWARRCSSTGASQRRTRPPRKRTQIQADGSCRDVRSGDIFAERDLWNIRRGRRTALLRLDVGRPDHLGPLLGFVGDKLAEVGG